MSRLKEVELSSVVFFSADWSLQCRSSPQVSCGIKTYELAFCERKTCIISSHTQGGKGVWPWH